MPALRKFLAFSLPIGLAVVLLTPGQAPEVHAASDNGALESPAELRLTALDTLMKGDKHNAVDLFEEAIRLATLQFGSDSTFLGDLYYEAGRLYLELDQFNQAEDYLRQAVKINPKNASARLALARLLDTRAKVQESISQIREALMINPASPVARYKFVQTLSKYGQSPSDKAIATQESYTVAMMQKAAREAVQKPASAAESKPKKAGKNIAVPSLPTNLVPLKEEEDKAFSKGEDAGKKSGGSEGSATKSDTAAQAPGGEPRAEGVEKAGASSALSLFPLKGMSHRKEQEQRDREAKAQAQRKEEEEKKKAAESDIVQKLKDQLRQHEKNRAAERAEREELARQAKAAKAEARAAKEQAKVETKPVVKAAGKPDAKGGKPDSSKAAAKPADKPAPAAAEAQPQQQQPQQQQQPVQQMMPPQMYMPYPPQMFSPPPKGKPGKGFVPPPPLTMPMYPGMMQPVVPQVIPAPVKPAAPKPKPEKPKPAEAKPVEDKPPPMASPGEDDPNFLLDWGELKKDKAKKKGK